MYEVTEIFKKMRLENLMSYFLSGTYKNGEGTYDSIYFERDALLECQLFENTGQAIKADMEKEKKSILDLFFGIRIEEALEKRLREDRDYQRINAETRREIKKIEKAELNREQWIAVDNALSACNERSSHYGKLAYHQGFQDAIYLLKGIYRLM